MAFYSIAAISGWGIFWLVIIIALVVLAIVTTIWGRKQKKKADEAEEKLHDTAMPMSLLIIDKKKMPLKDAHLPAFVLEGIPKRYRRNKAPIVKAKAGPKIMTFMCDEEVFDLIPVKQEIKAMVSGVYIVSVKSLRGPALTPQKKSKRRWFRRNKEAKG